MLFVSEKKSFVFTTLLFLVTLFTVTVGCSGNAIGDDGEPVVTVDDEVVTEAEISEQIDQAIQQQKQMMEMQGQSVEAEQEDMLRQQVRQQVIEQATNRLVLLQTARDKNLEVSDAEVDDFLAERMPDAEQQRAALLELGETVEEGRDSLKEMLLIQKLMEEEIGEIEISDQEARQHFDDNKEQYVQEEQVKARHILIGTEETSESDAEAQINQLKDEITDADDFIAMAEEHSDCPSSERGGDLGYFSRGQMVPEFEEVAFDAEDGEIVGPVQTQFGVHLILVEDHREAEQQQFEDVKEEIINRLSQQRQQEKAQQVVEKLREERDIEVAD
ncbi:MAG: peptidylprolyl isomerase [bacterium]